MKKNLGLVIFVLTMLVFASMPMTVQASSSDDFKVIKNAVKGKKSGSGLLLKISIFDKKKKKNTVKVTVPMALVEALSDSIDIDKTVDLKGKCKDLDIKRILKVLKDTGPMTLVEVDEEDQLIKIWIE